MEEGRVSSQNLLIKEVLEGICMLMSLKYSLHTEMMQLMEPEKFHYLRQSGCVSDPTINDVRDFANVSFSKCRPH